MSALVFAALIGLLQQEEPVDLGKYTPEQVVAMGREKWMDVHTEEHGASTAAMAGAESAYGYAYRVVNDKAIKSQPKAFQALADWIRVRFNDAGIKACDIGYAIGGGGTMWIPISAGVAADTEELLADLMRPKGIKQRATQASARAAIAKMRKRLAASKTDIQEYFPEGRDVYGSALADAAFIAETLELTVPKIRHLSKDQRERVFYEIKDFAELVTIYEEEEGQAPNASHL
ncbi:MAG: hypothetical protein KIT11_11555 [Fimbriimonadaceae bacterium]|nr:hypothetical protein [Fimbriimonadaceae bacterium]QYK55331.1 MAG: hypothetical protein KF733_09980 [Fimbriimonadaceae bacterium]